MKKNILVFLIIQVLMVVLLTGCADKGDKINETSVTIDKKGKISNVIVESFDKDYYNENELKGIIDTEVSNYCALTNNDKACKLNKFSVDDGIAKAEFEYATAEDYAKFNDVNFFYGSIKDAIDNGYETNVTLKSSESDTTIGQDEFSALSERYIIVVSEPIVVVMPKDIAYTTANIDIIDNNVAKMNSESSGLGYIVLNK